MRLKQRKSVLLPQPDGPISAVILFRGMSMVRSLSASEGPYQTFRPCVASTTGSTGSAGLGVEASGIGMATRRSARVSKTLISHLVGLGTAVRATAQ